MSETWRSGGKAQKFLEGLFRSKKVNVLMQPKEVYEKYDEFQNFSSPVFRKHWNLTRKLFETEDEDEIRRSHDYGGITEVDGIKNDGIKKQKLMKTEGNIAQGYDVKYVKPPMYVSTYIDPDTEQENCNVVVLFYHSIANVKFDIIVTNMEPILKIEYEWPSVLIDMFELFKDELELSKYHVKKTAIENSLQRVRNNIEDTPEGSIEIKLPVNVITHSSTFHKKFKKCKDGNIVLFFEFLCEATDYNVKKSEKTLKIT